MDREEKTKSLDFLNHLLGEEENVFFTGFKGLSAEQMNNLRKLIREEAHGQYKVAKNTFLTMVLENCKKEELRSFVEGPTGIAYSSEEPINLVKTLMRFAKENGAFDLRGGVIEGRIVTKENLAEIAVLPPREQLLATLCTQMQAPIANFANCLHQVIASVVYVLDAIVRSKQDISKGGDASQVSTDEH